jgi:hypothetical protein
MTQPETLEAMSQEPIQIAFIPDPQFFSMTNEIEALSLRKRSKWRKVLQDSKGVSRRVQFSNGKLLHKDHSKTIMLAPLSERSRLNIIGDADPRNQEGYRRMDIAFERGGWEAVSIEHIRIIDEAATGNHRSKPHKVRVPIKAGEPVRA